MAEIRAILEAVKRRDPDAAFAASMLHVQEAAKTALAALEAHVGTAERAAGR
jgi:DNA-binding FadR family transcriptional regulator